MARLSDERAMYHRLAELEDGGSRPGREIAAQALDLFEQGKPFAALKLALSAMQHSGRWFSLAGLIGQHVEEGEADDDA